MAMLIAMNRRAGDHPTWLLVSSVNLTLAGLVRKIFQKIFCLIDNQF